MPSAITPLGNLTLSSTASSVSFSSISGSYRDLLIVIAGQSSASTTMNIRINSDTAANYTFTYLANSGASGVSGNATSQTSIQVGNFAGVGPSYQAQFVCQILDYAQTDKNKMVLTRNENASYGGTEIVHGRWASSSAITTILVYPATGTWSAGSTFAIYGVSA